VIEPGYHAVPEYEGVTPAVEPPAEVAPPTAPPPPMPAGFEAQRAALPDQPPPGARLNQAQRRALSIPPGTGSTELDPAMMEDYRRITSKPPEQWTQADRDTIDAYTRNRDQALAEADHLARVQRLRTWQKSGERGSFSQKVPVRPEEIQPSVWTDIYQEARYHLNKVGQNFEAWKNAMVASMGDWVESHLAPIWQQITQPESPSRIMPRWDTGGTPAPPQPLPPPPPGARSWQEWEQARTAEGMDPAEIQRRRQAAMEPRIRGIVPPQPPVPISEFAYPRSAPPSQRGTAVPKPVIQETGPTSKLQEAAAALEARFGGGPRPAIPPGATEVPLTPPPPAEGALPYPSAGAPQAHETWAGTSALYDSGFRPREIMSGAFPGRESPHVGGEVGIGADQYAGRPNAPREPLARTLPVSGVLADEIWSKPVADGTIEVQRDPDTNEFVATKYFRAGKPPESVTGLGAKDLIDYLNGVRQREAPIPASQRVGRSSPGGAPESVARPIDATPATPQTPEDVRDILAQAVRESGLSRSAAPAMTADELQYVIAHGAKRAIEPPTPPPPYSPEMANLPKAADRTLQEQLRNAIRAADLPTRGGGPPMRLPEEEHPEPPERIAQAVSQITGGKPISALDPAVSRILADAVMRARTTEAPTPGPPPRPAGTSFPAPAPFAEPTAPFTVENVGTYKPIGFAEGNVQYQFTPAKTRWIDIGGGRMVPGQSTAVTHEMPLADWEHLRSTGTPVSREPPTPPKAPVLSTSGRPQREPLPTATSPKPVRERVKPAEGSAFDARETGADSWIVHLKPTADPAEAARIRELFGIEEPTAAPGMREAFGVGELPSVQGPPAPPRAPTTEPSGDTNVFITKPPRKAYEVYIGNTLMGRAPTLTLAKSRAIALAEQQAEAVNTPRPRGWPANAKSPAVRMVAK
jgi:hypothetical protein